MKDNSYSVFDRNPVLRVGKFFLLAVVAGFGRATATSPASQQGSALEVPQCHALVDAQNLQLLTPHTVVKETGRSVFTRKIDTDSTERPCFVDTVKDKTSEQIDILLLIPDKKLPDRKDRFWGCAVKITKASGNTVVTHSDLQRTADNTIGPISSKREQAPRCLVTYHGNHLKVTPVKALPPSVSQVDLTKTYYFDMEGNMVEKPRAIQEGQKATMLDDGTIQVKQRAGLQFGRGL